MPEDVCGNDFFWITINGTAVAYADLYEENNSSNWLSIVWDLSDYSGQTITLMFEVTTNSTLSSSLFLDDILMSSSDTLIAIEPSYGEALRDMYMIKRQFDRSKWKDILP